MANEGSDNKKNPNPSDNATGERSKSRRRRRGRRSGDRPQSVDGGASPQEAKGQVREGKAQSKETSGQPREAKAKGPSKVAKGQPKESKTKSRTRRRTRTRKADSGPREEPVAQAPRTLPPPPKDPPPTSLPPAAEASEPKVKERRPRRTSRREDASTQRRGRTTRADRSKLDNANAGQPVRWSQAPAPLPSASPPPVAEPPIRPRELGPPVFLGPSEEDYAFNEETAIDITPWEGELGEGEGDGTLYNTVVVKGQRSQRARIYDAGDSIFEKGETVAIEADAGSPGFGTVVQSNRRELVRGRLPRVLRRLHPNEVGVEARGARREQEVFRIARHVAGVLNLPIKIVRSQSEPSGKTVVFFACEERIDFRELYRRVSAAAQGRIELRQVGVRDAAKILGGIAPCGQPLCCATFLKDFAPVSIKMAKEQGLVLNPQRVSGLCGRLLCCLTYEDELYRTQRKLLPKLGKRVVTPTGIGKVRDVDVLSQTVRVVLDDGDVVTVKPDDIKPLFPSQQTGEERGERGERGDRQVGSERRRRGQDDGAERQRPGCRRLSADRVPSESSTGAATQDGVDERIGKDQDGVGPVEEEPEVNTEE